MSKCSTCKYKAYRFSFIPTKEQERQLAIEFDNARFIYNYCLDMRMKAYKRRGETLNYASLGKHITKLKKTSRFKWLKASTSDVLAQKLFDLDAAYKQFFRTKRGFPRFKKKTHSQSISYKLDQRRMHFIYKRGQLLKLPKLGAINMRWSQIPEGIPKRAAVSKTSTGKYFVSLVCEVDVQMLPMTGKSVGIDLGIKDVVVTSDGFFSGAPRFTYRNEKRLRKASKDLSRKTKGSNRWNKQRIAVAKIHEHIANSRKDFLHKLTTKLIRGYDHIYIEDLNVAGMKKNRNLAKAISDVGMYEITRQLEYKANWYGRTVTKIDRFFPSTKMCSSCGQIHDMKLSDRVMNCDCGLNLDRDLNAAINIKMAGSVMRGEISSDVGRLTT